MKSHLNDRLILRITICLIGSFALTQSTSAGEIRLKNEMIFEGTPVPITGMTEKTTQQSRGPVPNYPIILLDTGIKWYFVANRQLAEPPNNDALLDKYESFTIKQRKTGRSLTPTSLGAIEEPEPFNRFGRRQVIIRTQRGDVPILQGITRLDPRYLTIEGLSHVWEHGLATTSVPAPILDAIIKEAIDEDDPLEHLAVAKFYLQAGLYLESEQELRRIMNQFPDYRDRVELMFRQLQELIADRFIRELELRRNAGQHQLVLRKAREFPADKLSASVQQRVNELIQEHQDRSMRRDSALLQLGKLHAQLEDPKLIQATAAMRSTVRDRLDFESLERLDSFMNLVDAEDLSPRQKLALAYSGWILGSSNAIEDLVETSRLWHVRFLIREYLLSSEDPERKSLIAEISSTEGISIERLQAILQHLPPSGSAEEVVPGVPHIIEVATSPGQPPVKYSVLLPAEYSPHHKYPTVVALHAAKRGPESELLWWGGTAEKPGQSQRHGYIVIAPHYTSDQAVKYNYDVRSHHVVLESIKDARRRFSIDSDRVFLSGHGMGGNATLDIGMSHPHVFTGIVPICGLADEYCAWYWSNCRDLPMYVVGGELDGDWFEHNARFGHMNRMLKLGYDITCAVYRGRGREMYYEEIHQIFDWMGRYTRTRFQTELSAKTIRPTDNRFGWIRIDGLPAAVIRSGVLQGDSRLKTSPMTVSGRVTPGNTINVTSGARQNTIWLSPEFVDFEKRVAVRHKGRQKFNDFPRPSMADMLEDFRARHDREKLYWFKLTF